eukprot:TRINITY_DN14556_c0_g1_i2.p2 TRINITY_DN14556_c0_g1~~TRINITY_DN14556_c0_g1_i2.p2  ORF type:complete len:126 (+),score=17.51 TRINITY_DN14556_c0_g1_i2:729-1106(+)
MKTETNAASETPGAGRAKRVFDSMHNRTFFQGATSCFLQDRCKVSEKPQSEIRSSKAKAIDYNNLASMMLKECGIIRKRHNRAPTVLKKGEGKLSCSNRLFLTNTYLLSTTNHAQHSFAFPKTDP